MGKSRLIDGFSRLFDDSGVPETLVHLLSLRAAEQPDKPIYIYLPDGEHPGPTRSFGSLDENARSIAAALQTRIASGDRVLLFYPPGLEFIDAFFGCLYAGVIAIPAFPPDPNRIDKVIENMKALVADSGANLVLTTAKVVAFIEPMAPFLPGLDKLQWLATDTLPSSLAASWTPRVPAPDELAYFQYTSGSTRTPRGVCLTHANLAHNAARISQLFQLTQQDVGLIWLPMYHNMGLIGGALMPFFASLPCYLMSPQAILQNPLAWLRAVTTFKATISGGPNFSYDLCSRRIPADQRAGLDLSSWQVAFNGAEPVRPETIDRFCKIFGPVGFNRSAFYPCYGMAEATLIVTGTSRAAGPTFLPVDRTSLENRIVQPVDAQSPSSQMLVGCGRSIFDQELLIVDPDQCVVLPEGRVGEIWLRGPSVAPGYWNRPDDTTETFQGYLAGSGTGPYLRTGDLGFLYKQECFITGRLKELIIIHGRNLYPQDIEQAAAPSHPALVPAGSAVFSIQVDGEEKLAIVQEVNLQVSEDFPDITGRIRQAIFQACNVQVYAVILVEPGTVPKTISGKIQRQPCRQQYLDGVLKILHSSVLEARPAVPEPPPGGAEGVSGPAGLLHAALRALPPDQAQNLLETNLRQQVALVLGVPAGNLNVEAPLSSAGIDSITSIEVANNLENTLGVTIPIADVIQGASLRDLSRSILERIAGSPTGSGAVSDEAGTVIPAAPEEERFRDYPLSYGQRALWIIQCLNPETVAHNLVYAVAVHTNVDVPKFKRAFARLVLRHAVLRTCFLEVDGEPVQHVCEDAEHYRIDEVDGAGWTPGELETYLDEQVYKPFDLKTGPLIRMSLVRRSENESVAVFAMHHIITDMWSVMIIVHDLLELYRAEVTGSDPNLKPVTVTYTDTVRWQADMLASPKGEEHLAYWKERLSESPPALLLPTDYPRTGLASARASTCALRLDTDLALGLRRLADQYRANLFATLLAVFDVLLYRYTGQKDLLVGTPKASRNRQNAKVAGYFINPVVLRAQLDGDMRFCDLLTQVYQGMREDFQHDEYPFPLLVEKLQPNRNPGSNPLTPVFFAWQKTNQLVGKNKVSGFALNQEQATVEMDGISMNVIPLKARVTATDLALLVAEMDETLGMTIEFSTDLFAPETIERMLSHLETLLQSVLENPEQVIGRMNMLPDQERRLLVEEWNQPDAATGEEPLIHEIIDRHAGSDTTALEAGDRRVSYAELCRASTVLAAKLREMGFGPGMIAGVCAERSPEMITGLLAILKAGGVYLPLDPDFPASRLAWMLADSCAALLLVQKGLEARLPENTPRQIVLDDVLEGTPRTAAGEVSHVLPEDPAYLMYTSGSTGLPKGVLISHRAIAHHCLAMQVYYQLTPQDRALQFSSLNFDASLEQIFTTLMTGAVLVLRDNLLWDPAQFSAKIAERNLSVVNIPPAYWDQWAASESEATAPVANPQLRLVIIGGDVMRPETFNQWMKTPLRAARLINAYGPTEAVITATAYPVPLEPVHPGKRIPIGRALAGRSAYIVDEYQQPAPVGIPGELYIGGICTAIGYLNQPERTSEKFITGLPVPGGRLYRTGDLARFLSDGNIEFLGRIDNQVKILGMRIEPGEIEYALKQHPAVADAAVLHITRPSSRLAACIVAREGPEQNPAALSAFLARSLPQYMIPADYLFLDAFPLLETGKLDRAALTVLCEQRIEQGVISPQAAYTPPRNEIESYLVCLWQELLGVKQVGIYDNFFALGGHSLLAIRMMSRMQEQYHIEIPLRNLFETPNIASVAAAVVEALVVQEEDEDLDRLIAGLEDESGAGG